MATLTVSDTTPRVQYTATSSQTVFAYGFAIFEDADLKVYQDTTLLTLTTHYTVSGAGTSAGGNVTLVTGATTGDIITIYRDLAVSRSSDYQTGGDLLAETLNDDLDKVVMMVQQSERDIASRTIRFGQFVTGLPLDEITDNATDRADKVITFDSSGQPQATLEIGTNQGDWAASTSYVERDIIKDTSNNNIYLCNEAHTSSGSQPISSNTDSGKWDLLVDAASATTSATNAATSATAAASSATSSASSATSSASSATTATTQASAASTSATAAASSATSAASSATSAAASFDSFDDVYLGSKSSAPTLDNDGDALQEGALYWNSATDAINVFNGSTWEAITTDTDTTYTAGDGLDLTGTAFSTDLLANGGLEIQSTELSVAQGISQYDVAQFAASVADNDFLKIDGTAVEGRSAAEVLSDISSEDNSWTGSQRATAVTDNDGSYDMDAGQNFITTPSGATTITFTNITDGQSGFIKLINSGGETISLHSNSKGDANLATTVTTAGTYLLSYFSDGTDVWLTNSAIYA